MVALISLVFFAGGFYPALDGALQVNAAGGGDTDAPQVKVNPVLGRAAAATTRFEGASGGTWKLMARIMSFSSWPRMWQCHTYSQPKLLTALLVCAGLLVAGSILVNCEHGSGEGNAAFSVGQLR